jgi:hypothetical protein
MFAPLLVPIIIFVFEHAVFGPLHIIEVTPLDSPDEEQPGADSDADGKKNEYDDRF